MKGKSSGSIVITLVFILIMLGGLVKVFMVMLGDEITGHREISFCREFLRTGGDLMNVALKKKAFLKTGKVTLPKFVFTKGSEELIPTVNVKVFPKVPLRRIDVQIKGKTVNLRIRKIFLEPPGGSNHPIYAYNGNKPIDKKSFPRLALGDYAGYQDFFLPNKSVLDKEGLSGFLYMELSGTIFSRQYRLPLGGIIRGKGVLYNNHNIVIRADTTFPDKIWLLSTRKIILEDNVCLDNAFLYANDDIYLGHNTRVCGIIVAAKGVRKKGNATYKENKAVLETFVTPSYCY